MEVNILLRVAVITLFPLALFCSRAGAAELSPASDSDAFNDWLAQGSISGELKTMHFFKEFTGTVENKRTHSFGGNIQYESPAFYGLSVGAAGYGAWNLGMNPDDPENKEGYLPSENVTVLGKAYLRYQGYGLDIKGGRIDLDTPFANGGQGRTMIPALYQGFGGTYALPMTDDLKLHGYRIYRFKAESSEHFEKGDAGYPEIDDTSIPSVDSDGFTAFGLRYGKLYDAKAEAWYYDFDKRAQMAYGGVEIPIQSLKFDGWTPYWGAQFLREWDTSGQVYPYKDVDARLFSGRLGVRSRNHTFFVAGTHVPRRDDAFLNGAYFAPYSYGIYETTPLENGQPLASMVTSSQPGNAWAARYIYHNDKALAVLGYTRLELEDSPGIHYPLPAKDINAGFMVLGYNLTERLHVEFEFDYVDSPSPVTGDYHAERFRVVYHFGKMTPDYGH